MKKASIFSIILFVSIVIAIFSCNKNAIIKTPDLGYTYFPTNIGHYIIYDVDSSKKDCFTKEVSRNHYQIKEIIASEFIDNQGRQTFRIERFRKDSIFYPEWTIYNVWTANITPTTAERFENNIRYIKLVFPIAKGKTWNGNSMNTEIEEDYEYINIHEPGVFNSFNFDSVITVQQADELNNLINPKYKVEQYATGVGLIYRKNLVMETKIDSLGIRDTTCYIDYTEKIIDYGN